MDEGESWSEGTREDAIVFKDIPAGDYYLNIESKGATATMSGIIPLSIQLSYAQSGRLVELRAGADLVDSVSSDLTLAAQCIRVEALG